MNRLPKDMEERTVKKSEVRSRLKVTRYGYAKLIASGILDAPIGEGHGFHTESQIARAQQRLYDAGRQKPLKTTTAIRALSTAMKNRIRNYQNAT